MHQNEIAWQSPIIGLYLTISSHQFTDIWKLKKKIKQIKREDEEEKDPSNFKTVTYKASHECWVDYQILDHICSSSFTTLTSQSHYRKLYLKRTLKRTSYLQNKVKGNHRKEITRMIQNDIGRKKKATSSMNTIWNKI